MPNIDPLTYIKNALARDFQAQAYRQQRTKTAPPSLVITLSRDYGALGEAVAEALAQTLKIPLYDQEVLELLAKKAKADAHSFRAYDEQSNVGIEAFFYGLVSGNPATLQNYRHHLVETLVELARTDCLIVGRGAHLVLAGQRIFRVRVVGNNDICAQRIALDLNISLSDAKKRVAEINHKRNKAIVDMFSPTIEHCSLEHANTFDLVINTDHISVEIAKDLILLALRGLGQIADGAGR